MLKGVQGIGKDAPADRFVTHVVRAAEGANAVSPYIMYSRVTGDSRQVEIAHGVGKDGSARFMTYDLRAAEGADAVSP